MKRSISIFFVILFCFASVNVFAQESEAVILEKANNRAEVAMQLFQEAQGLLAEDITGSDLQAAIGLFIKAGQEFEKAGNAMRQLGPQYVTEQQVIAVDQAVVRCVELIKQCNQMLHRMR